MPDEQRWRPNGRLRRHRRSLGDQPVQCLDAAVPHVCRGLHDERPDRLLLPLLLQLRQHELPRLPQARCVARRLLPDGQPLRQRIDVQRRGCRGARSHADARRSTGDAADVPDERAVWRSAAGDARRIDVPASRVTELSRRARHDEQPRDLEVPCRLDDAGKLHVLPRVQPDGRVVRRGVRRRDVHPPGGDDAAARFACGSTDVPPCVPEFRRPPVARRRPQRHGWLVRRRAVVRAARRWWQPDRVPTGHVRAR